MDNWKKIIWQQLGASIDSLENAIKACPEKVWGDKTGFHEFWYMVYHTLFFLDYYMSGTSENFAPPEPFTLSELDPSGLLPERAYTKDELLKYLEHGRQKSRKVIKALTEETAHQPCGFKKDLTVAELCLYTMRHVQHHSAQLNLLLRQQTDSAPKWVSKVKS
ncbi:MAG: DinB family protein [candidate division Zixibacteria bacterium]|nr:DinB family protein [candidate division Zixibacteria bacterium]